MLIDKYPELIKSLVALDFMTMYFKDMKELCNENLNNLNRQKLFVGEQIHEVNPIMYNVPEW